ncbi:MAG: T9SS type A sorting domain-containing protein [Ignavibacteriales bacterium]|nr:T9SS type A sorting domain-containing protein [Ignavibacteriales bacterium]
MGSIWLEKSTDNGVTWQLMNNAHPLNTYEAESPSICSPCWNWQPNSNFVVAFQEKGGAASTESHISMVFATISPDVIYPKQEITPLSSLPFSVDASPVVTWGSQLKGMVLWKTPKHDNADQDELDYCYFVADPYANFTITEYDRSFVFWVPTGVTLVHPTLSWESYSPPDKFHLAWEREENGIKSVYYTYGVPNTNNTVDWQTSRNVSSGSGYQQNYNPSIISFQNGARMCWVGQRSYIGEQGNDGAFLEKNIVFKDPDPVSWRFWDFGSNVNPPSIANAGGSKYIVAWTEPGSNGYTAKYTDNSSLRNARTILAGTGKDVQLNNSPTPYFSDIYASIFNNAAAPYSFTTTAGLQTYDQIEPNSGGREGIVVTDSCEFYFNLSDVEFEGQEVGFIDIPNDAPLENVAHLNTYACTKPFTVNAGSTLNYSVTYGITDSINAAAALAGGKTITFKVLLVDDATNEVLGTFDDVTYTETNAYRYANIAYEVDLTGITDKIVRLKLCTATTISEPRLSMSDKNSNASISTAKGNTKKIKLKLNTGKVTTYALDQNYPNPFNPATTISYQLPKAGIVTLKIYDMLGKEVKVLVNEYKESGKYTAEFNGAGLASGVYVYRLDCNDFSATKKLTLLK